MTRAAIWTQAILFQLAWVSSTWGAARGMWWLALVATLVVAAQTLRYGSDARADVVLALVAAAVGFALDTLWVNRGLLSYASPVPWASAAPVWIVALWINFALCLNHSLRWLLGRPGLAALLGAIGGPLSYFGAARTWHAVTIAEPRFWILVALGGAWAVVTPLLCHLATRLKGARAVLNDFDLPKAMSA